MKHLIAALVLVLVLSSSTPAAAICASPPPLRDSLGEARAAFVGTVLETSNEDREASVRIESIWLGRLLPEVVEISGVPAGASGSPEVSLETSEDRMFEEGERYLFVPQNATPPFQDNACTATTLYTDEVAALEPEGAVAPDSGGQGPAWVFVVVALGAVGLWQVRRARRRTEEVEIS